MLSAQLQARPSAHQEPTLSSQAWPIVRRALQMRVERSHDESMAHRVSGQA